MATATETTTTGAADNRPPHPSRTSALPTVLVLAALVVAGMWSINSLGINFASIIGSLDNAVDFIGRMFPLDFPPVAETLGLLAETLAIVFLATVLSVVLSVPLALAAARPTTSGPLARSASRVVIVVARVTPDLVLAIFFLRVFGLGPTAGILALGIHSIGMVARLYADAIEDLDDGPREAVETTGATRRQQIAAVIPQTLMPQLIATALHRLDFNLRNSILLGYVGVGGIGLAISDALRTLNYQQGMALALIVLALCIGIELISGLARRALLNRSDARPATTTWADQVLDRSRTGSSTADRRLSPPWTPARVRRLLTVVVIVVFTLASLTEVELSPRALWEGLLALPETTALFFPPTAEGRWDSLLGQLLVTLQIALAATLLGTVPAVPIGILAARNVVPHRGLHAVFRTLIVAVRGVPELILAIIFVVISGLGAVAGTLALSVGAVGLLAKLIADSLEESDTRVQEAVRATGAGGAQVFAAATLRQTAPAIVAHVMYLLDYNFRSATLLGIVGAGGVGFLLLEASRVNQFQLVTMILVLMIIVALCFEALAVWLRRRVR